MGDFSDGIVEITAFSDYVTVGGMRLTLAPIGDKVAARLGGLLLGHFVDRAAAIEAAEVRITSERWRSATGKEMKR